MSLDLSDAFPEGAWDIPLVKGQPPTTPGRTAAAFEVRESDLYDRLLFDGMRQQTYELYRDNPWVRAVLETGMAPMAAKGRPVDALAGGVGDGQVRGGPGAHAGTPGRSVRRKWGRPSTRTCGGSSSGWGWAR